MRLQQLLEGLRFTNREIKAVKKNQRNILVAFEFEFTPDANAINQYRSNVHDTKSEEPTPERDRLTWDDLTLGNFSEYDELYHEEEREWIEDQLIGIKDSWTEDKENELNEEHDEFLTAVKSLTETFVGDRSKYPTSRYGVVNVPESRLTDLQNAIDNINQEVETDADYKEVAIMLTNLSKYHTLFADTFQYINPLTDNVDEFYSEFRGVYKSGSNFDKFITNLYYNSAHIQEFVDTFENFELTHDFSDFDYEQDNLLLDTTKRAIKEEIDHYESLDIDFDGMNAFNTVLRVLIEHPQTTIAAITDMVEDKIESEWESQKEFEEESMYEYGGFEFSTEGMMQAIEEIQDNNHVAFYNYEDVDDEDADPIVPYDGTQHNTGSGDNSNLVKNFIKEYGHDFNLNFDRDFEPKIDIEGHRMIELKSNPVPLMDAIKLMNNMFGFIKQFGDVSHGHAGLHTNMSIKGKTFSKNEFNKAKLMVLVDDELLHEMFPVRNHIAKTLKHIDSEDAFKIAKIHALSNSRAGSQEYSSAFEQFFSSNYKMQGINFQHMKVADISKRRIEFRAIGGKDYIDRNKTIEWWIYRFAYVMEAAFDDTFLEKEYLKELITILDRPIKRDSYLLADNFVELVYMIKVKGLESYEEMVQYSLDQKEAG